MESAIPSPCNNNCIIDPKTNYCKGCFRTISEIISWLNYSDKEKLLVVEKIKQRKKEG